MAIFCLIGKSGTGKSTLRKQLLKTESLNLKPYTILTSRLQRDGELEDGEYCFVEPDDQRLNTTDYVYKEEYETINGKLEYILPKKKESEIKSNNFLLVTTLNGYKKIVATYSDEVYPLYIVVDNNERFKRIFLREGKQKHPNYEEALRRLVSDEIDFSIDRQDSAGVKIIFHNNRGNEGYFGLYKYIKLHINIQPCKIQD